MSYFSRLLDQIRLLISLQSEEMHYINQNLSSLIMPIIRPLVLGTYIKINKINNLPSVQFIKVIK